MTRTESLLDTIDVMTTGELAELSEDIEKRIILTRFACGESIKEIQESFEHLTIWETEQHLKEAVAGLFAKHSKLVSQGAKATVSRPKAHTKRVQKR